MTTALIFTIQIYNNTRGRRRGRGPRRGRSQVGYVAGYGGPGLAHSPAPDYRPAALEARK